MSTKHPLSEDPLPSDLSPEAYTPQEIANLCGLSRRRVYDWLAWGWLRGQRRGGRWVVTKLDWDYFTRICRSPRGQLMPSLREWQPLWVSGPRGGSAE